MDDRYIQNHIEKAKRGDHEAFAFLIAANARTIAYFTTYVLGDKRAGETAAHEAVFRMCLDLSRLRKACSFKAWMYRELCITCTETKNKMRNDGGKAESLRSSSREDGRQGRIPLDAYLTSEDLGLLEAMQSLPKYQRAGLFLFLYEGLDESEIAEALNISEKSVASNLDHAFGSFGRSCDSSGSLDGIHSYIKGCDPLLEADLARAFLVAESACVSSTIQASLEKAAVTANNSKSDFFSQGGLPPKQLALAAVLAAAGVLCFVAANILG